MISTSVSDFETGLAKRLGAARDRFDLPGIAADVRLHGRHSAGAAGLASTRAEGAMSPDDRLPASCAMKLLVALLTLHLAEAKRLDIDTDIGVFLPNLKRADEARTGITLRHLLTHTACYVEPTDPRVRWSYDWEHFAAWFPQRVQAFAPGTVWSYTHTGFAILQKVIEAATGRPIEDLLTETIFDPLTFNPELLSQLGPKAPNVAGLHILSPRSKTYEPMRPPLETGFLRFSISDFMFSVTELATLAQLLSGALAQTLPHLEASRRQMHAVQITLPTYIHGAQGELMPRAFGLGLADYGRFKGVNGSYVGSTCALRFDDAGEVAFAVAVNAWLPHARDVVADWISDQVPGTRPSSTPQTPFADLDALTGVYDGLMLGAMKMAVQRDGDGLRYAIRRTNAPPQTGRLRHRDDGTFAIDEGAPETCLAWARTPDGKPYAMVGTSALFQTART